MKPSLRITLALVLCLPGFAANRMDLEHLTKIHRVADPQFSPDGKSIVIVVSRPNYAEDRYDADLVLVDVSTGHQRKLTHDRRTVSSPRWSPVGDHLAFLATGANGKPQIFVMPMTGGDAVPITKSAAGIQQFAWRPDGRMIAFAAADEPPKKNGEEKFNDSFEVGNDDFLIKEELTPTHLWLVTPEGGEPHRLTSGSWSLPISHPPGSPASPIAWSPDRKFIAFVKVESPHSGDGDRSTLQILDVEKGDFRALTTHTKYEGYPLFSPDGSRIAYWFPRDGQPKNVNEIYWVPAAGGEGTNVTRGIDRNIQRAIWTPDGKSLLVGANDATTVGLWIQPLDASAAHRVPLGKICPNSAFWVDIAVGPHGEIAFTGSEPHHPAELYYLASPNDPAKRLTEFNQEVASLELGKTETVDWQGPDGFSMDGVVTYPPDFSPTRKYPLVLYVHGGPRSASKEIFSVRAQLLAANGWVIFEPNYRGSDNLGNKFQSAIWGDAGDGPGRDVMSGVELLKKRGFVDESRMAVTGWSYGGYSATIRCGKSLSPVPRSPTGWINTTWGTRTCGAARPSAARLTWAITWRPTWSSPLLPMRARSKLRRSSSPTPATIACPSCNRSSCIMRLKTMACRPSFLCTRSAATAPPTRFASAMWIAAGSDG
jgi:dipeptidyl aminopeptidase/acylaminoacyl peptidase